MYKLMSHCLLRCFIGGTNHQAPVLPATDHPVPVLESLSLRTLLQLPLKCVFVIRLQTNIISHSTFTPGINTLLWCPHRTPINIRDHASSCSSKCHILACSSHYSVKAVFFFFFFLLLSVSTINHHSQLHTSICLIWI